MTGHGAPAAAEARIMAHPAAAPAPEWLLTIGCRDRVGIVAAVSGFLARHDGFILESQQFADLASERFFMRVRFRGEGPWFPAGEERLRAEFGAVASPLALDWRLNPVERRVRAVIAVSRASHCLHDLLYRWRSGALPLDVAGVVSNHPDLRPVAEWYGLPFLHLPVDPDRRGEQEAALLEAVEEVGAELLVLARYMQVLSPALCDALAGRCVNIHHSFLPGFKGARPYHAAHARGVKLIGATAHFVTADLDDGPIIEQAVERVDHRASVDDLIRIGRDIESRVLARALLDVAERRVFVIDDRTVVLR